MCLHRCKTRRHFGGEYNVLSAEEICRQNSQQMRMADSQANSSTPRRGPRRHTRTLLAGKLSGLNSWTAPSTWGTRAGARPAVAGIVRAQQAQVASSQTRNESALNRRQQAAVLATSFVRDSSGRRGVPTRPSGSHDGARPASGRRRCTGGAQRGQRMPTGPQRTVSVTGSASP